MVDMPSTAKPWGPATSAPAPSVPRAPEPLSAREEHSISPSIPRKAISLADWAGVERNVDEDRNNMFVPPEVIPDGFVVEWKRTHVLGKEDKAHGAELRRSGWRPVPASSEGFAEQFAAYISPGSDVIEYEGTILMIRPKTMSEQAAGEQKKKANRLVQDKMDEMGMTSKHKDIPGQRFTLSRGYEERLDGGNPAAMTVPD